VWNSAGFDAIDPAVTDRLMGLFDPSHMKFEYDRPGDVGGEPSLAEMTSKALDILSRNSRGFFLMVEGGRIDHAHHEGNAYRALTDTIAFAEAVQVALDRTDPSDTLIVVTADHSHTLTLGGYHTRGNDVFGKVIKNDPFGEPEREPALDAYGQPYTSLGYYNGPGHPGANLSDPNTPFHHPDPVDPESGSRGDRPDLRNVDTGDPDYLQEAAIPLRKETHSGEDVAVYATGPGAALIHGVQEQNYVYHAMVEAFGWNGDRGSADENSR
jgi:alkaline phosphatase